MPESNSSPSRHKQLRRRRHPRRRWFVAAYSAFLVVVIVTVLRLVTVQADVWDYYYPELKASGATSAPASRDDDTLDVLTLGGSVLLQVESVLEMRLRAELGDRIRCYHLSTTAHTSRDSLLKYQQLAGRKFDVVIICHGINDVRMNYWPKSRFQADYTHCPWYAHLAHDVQLGQLTLWDRVAKFAKQEGLGPPAAADYPLGNNLKTPLAFENNLSQLATEAAARDDQVVFLTMASYLPNGYSREAFQDGALDYGSGDAKYAVELWGEPKHVVTGILEHNRRTRAVAGRHEHVHLVDIEASIEASGQNFSDVCHLTRSGQQRLIGEVLPVVVKIVRNR
jgi:lysophospholipase L1-like esterase